LHDIEIMNQAPLILIGRGPLSGSEEPG
jgi:hypothetical protein